MRRARGRGRPRRGAQQLRQPPRCCALQASQRRIVQFARGNRSAPPLASCAKCVAPRLLRPRPMQLRALTTVALLTGYVCVAQETSTPAALIPPAAAPSTTVVVGPDPKPEPFSFADFTWLNGNSRQVDFPMNTPVFTGEFSFDSNYVFDFAHPKDDTLIGSTNSGRTGEFQVEQLGVGGDFHWKNVRGRLLTQFGLYATMTPRNDASPSRGQWNLADAFRYISEAYAGYHFDVMNGLNVDAGIFLSYIGLCSYYNYENWIYQMSYVSANTPWFFNGVRIQMFPSDTLKIELWLING